MNFITKADDAYSYYVNVLLNNINTVVNDEEQSKSILIRLLDSFENQLLKEAPNTPSVKDNPNHPTRILSLVCFVSDVVFRTALTTAITNNYGEYISNPAFGVEYYTYDFEGQFTNPGKPYYKSKIGYYIDVTDKLWNNIKGQYVAKEKLTKPDKFKSFNVINFETLSKRLKTDMRNYYAEHPELKNSKNRDLNLQKIFSKVLGELSASVAQSQTHTKNNLNF